MKFHSSPQYNGSTKPKSFFFVKKVGRSEMVDNDITSFRPIATRCLDANGVLLDPQSITSNILGMKENIYQTAQSQNKKLIPGQLPTIRPVLDTFHSHIMQITEFPNLEWSTWEKSTIEKYFEKIALNNENVHTFEIHFSFELKGNMYPVFMTFNKDQYQIFLPAKVKKGECQHFPLFPKYSERPLIGPKMKVFRKKYETRHSLIEKPKPASIQFDVQEYLNLLLNDPQHFRSLFYISRTHEYFRMSENWCGTCT